LLAGLFGARCALPVRDAADKEPVTPGTVYIAVPDYHLLVERERGLALSADDSVNHSRPSIDVLFESVAEVYGPAAAGIVLTGANEDGAAGLQSIAAAGGHPWVQDPATAEVAVMPAEALRRVPSSRVLALPAMLHALQTRGAAAFEVSHG
jgi:two-component system chemotaxis response regulator CheB